MSHQAVTLDTGSADREGLLIFRDGRLLVVLSCLSDIHEDLEGHWFIEATFGDLPAQQPATFETLGHFEEWLTTKDVTPNY